MNINPENLKDMAVAAVAAYSAHGTSLNDSITKVAMDTEMNSDQVKRLVETTNQMAYLSELDGRDDRTFEFDVANYDDVIDGFIPSSDLEKAASGSMGCSPLELASNPFNSIEKVAFESTTTLDNWSKGQKLQALKKVASQQRVALDELKDMEYGTLVKLAQHKAIISRDPLALEKMAKFDNQLEMTRLVFGHDKVASDVRSVWSKSDLQHIQALSTNLTMAKTASESIANLEPQVESAEALLKTAFVGAIAAGISNKVKSSIPGAAKKVGGIGNSKPVKEIKKAYGTFEAVDSTNEVSKNTSRKHNAWSSLRG